MGAGIAFKQTPYALSGRGYLRHIARWQAAGYRVKLIFLQLGSPEEAIERVAERVRQGGHHIPADVIRRRFAAGSCNFAQHYAPAVDSWALYDNGGPQAQLIGWSEKP